ncbi:MAG: YraN family protein [Clostridia bacterium]|nr:YraN family protein [Clostridia bacterium]
MTKQKDVGNHGEQIACKYLEDNGYAIVQKNYYECCGEIDIIAQSGIYIVFAEVKTRKHDTKIRGIMSVNRSKRKKIVKTAYKYIIKNNCKLQPRFDVIEIYLKNDGSHSLQHIQNAFMLEDRDYELF